MNKELLLEDVKFPLKWDSDNYKIYIFDSNNQMIAQVAKSWKTDYIEHPFEKLIGDYKDDGEVWKEEGKFREYQGEFYGKGFPYSMGMVRGWGRLQYKDRPEERQDNIAEYILNVINT